MLNGIVRVTRNFVVCKLCALREMFSYINSVVVFLSTVGFGCETGNVVLMEFLGIDVVGHDIQNIDPQVSLLRVIGSS